MNIEYSEYPYSLQGDRTKVRQLSQQAQSGDSASLEKLRSLGLDAAGNIVVSRQGPTFQPAPPPQPKKPYTDAAQQLQQDRLQLNRDQFELAKQRYADQQAAAAERMNAQRQQNAERVARPASQGGGGGGGGRNNQAIEEKLKKENEDLKKKLKDAGKKGGGGGGGRGGGKRPQTASQMARDLDNKNKAKERANDKADKRAMNKRAREWTDNSGKQPYKDFGEGAAEQMAKDDALKEWKSDSQMRDNLLKEKLKERSAAERERIMKEHEERKKAAAAEREQNAKIKPAVSDTPRQHRMTHAYGNPYARMVRARGDLG